MATFYCKSNGSSANSGSSTAPFPAAGGIQQAISQCAYASVNTITLLDSSVAYVGNFNAPYWTIITVAAEPGVGKPIIMASSNGNLASVQDFGILTLSNLKIESGGYTVTGAYARQVAIMDIHECTFGSMTTHVAGIDGASINFSGTTTISGGANNFLSLANSRASIGGIVLPAPAIAFNHFLSAVDDSFINCRSGAFSAPSIAGGQWSIVDSALAKPIGYSIPGSSASNYEYLARVY